MEEILAEVVQLAAKEDRKTKKANKKAKEVKQKTEEKATETQNFFKNIDWQNPSWDLFLIIFFVIGALLYGLSLGKDRIIAILVSIYMALAVVQALPAFALDVKFNDNFTFQITAFVAVFVVLFFLLSRSAVLSALSPSAQGKWWQVIIFSILHVGLLVSVSMSFLPAPLLNKFSETTQYIFISEWPKFGWIIAPIVAMIFFGKGNKEA